MAHRNSPRFLLIIFIMLRTTELISHPLSHSGDGSERIPSFDSLPGNTTVLSSADISLPSPLSEQPKANAVSARKPATPNISYAPKVSKDNRDRWVYGPWAVSLARRYRMSRINSTPNIGRVHVASFPNRIYEPAQRRAVCIGSTMPYGIRKVLKWINLHVYKHKHTSRAYFMELQRNVFRKGNSEMCHVKKYSTWMVCQECALKRNQRLESLIPKYPLQQKIRKIGQR